MSKWASRVALITGGGGGIGRAVAEKLLVAGASVMLADHHQERLEAAAGALASKGAVAITATTAGY